MILVDTNVLLDVLTTDPRWLKWSLAALDAASLHGSLLINDVISAELAARFDRVADLEEFVVGTGLEVAPTPRSALFLAGKTFVRYRRNGGTRTGVLSDFFIGAHAAVLQMPLLTRDVGRYRTYFPTVELITPGTP